MPGPRTGARCASWSSRDPPQRRTAGSGRRRCSAWPTTMPLLDLFDGSPHGPARAAGEAVRGAARARLDASRLSPHVTADEWPALLERRRSTFGSMSRGSREAMAGGVPRGGPTPFSPWGLRLPSDSKVDDHPAFRPRPGRGPGRRQPADRAGLPARDGMRILDLCAGAGGKSLALRPPRRRRPRSSPADTNRARAWRSCRRAPSGPAHRSRRGCSMAAARRPARRPRRAMRHRAGRRAVQRVRHLAAQSRRAAGG